MESGSLGSCPQPLVPRGDQRVGRTDGEHAGQMHCLGTPQSVHTGEFASVQCDGLTYKTMGSVCTLVLRRPDCRRTDGDLMRRPRGAELDAHSKSNQTRWRGYLDDDGEAGIAICGPCFVKTFAAHPGLPRDLTELA